MHLSLTNMENKREIAKQLCISLVNYMKENPNYLPPESNIKIDINLPLIYSWYRGTTSNEHLDQEHLASAVGYNNFCLDVIKFLQ